MRKLADTPGADPVSWDAHVRAHGVLRPMQREQLVEQLESARATGRGGAAYPVAAKLTRVARGERAPVVVVNGSEGEPGSLKDKALLARSPHLVLDGAQLLAHALGAVEVVVWLGADGPAPTVRAAAAERMDSVPTRVVQSLHGFVGGESSAVSRGIDRGVPLPLGKSPRPSERGVDGRPTLVHNVETLADIAMIARYADRWSPTMLVTVHHGLGPPRVVEVPAGARLSDLVDRGPVLVGGYHGRWVADVDLDLALTDDRASGVLGAGIVMALPPGACGLAESARVATWLAAETAGQCGPCVNGLPAVAGAMHELVAGDASALARIERWLPMVDGRGACSHPDGSVRFLRSALECFSAEVLRHIGGQGCQPAGWALPVPA